MNIDKRSVMSGNYHTLTVATPVAISKEPKDYNTLINKPSINGTELVGDISLEQLGLGNVDTIISEVDDALAQLNEAMAQLEDIPSETLTQEDIDNITGT